jgi:hypothetical protein
MAYSYNIYAGNGSTTQFTVGFPYIRKDHVVAYVNYTLTSAFAWVNDSTIQFTTAPGAGVRVEIRRYSPTNSRLVDYADGSTLVAADLDTDSTQHLYKEQELDDDIKQSVYVDPTTGLPTASGQRITNVLDPVAAQDAATKNYVDTTTVASAGDTMTGPLAMSTNKITGLGNPTNAQDAATKTYVDSTTVASAGDSMTGPLAMGANKITGLGDPTSAQDAATKTYVDSTTWNNTDETIDSTETWVSSNAYIGTTGATTNEMDARHDTLVQTSTPAGTGWRVGKTWLQNDTNKTLSVWNGSGWLGVASGGTFTTQNTVIYVDAATGSDTNDGHRIINPMKTIKAAVASAQAGWTIKVAPGVYQESLPIDITVANLSIVGEAQRSCFINPTVATETQIMFRCNSGTYIDGFTFAGLKASGVRGGHAIDSDATYGLPAAQGWVAGFYPGAIIRKSPYINNATNFADSGIDNATFDPNNYSGTGGDLTSGPAGGGIIVDGSLPDVTSPLRSFVVNEFTQVCLDGPGLLVCNNGYAQAVSFFGLFCHYHAKALSGGQINMEVGTTDFGRYGLIADGKSTTPIFTATSNGSAAAAAVTFAINAPSTGSGWFGDANRPAINMLAEVTVSGTTYLYPILSSGVNGSGWNVTISRPNPSNRSENLGLNVTVPSGTQWRFYLRSMVSTASHTMEYAGSGCNYNALPENGGVPIEANESINRNGGKVWLTSTDQSGKFKVGDTFAVDQQTGYVTIDPQSVAINVVSDLSPELGGDLDVLARNIYSSVGDIGIQDAFNTGVNLMLVRESSLATAYPVVTQYDIGTDPNQVPLNGLLGTMAFQDSAGVNLDQATINTATISSGTATLSSAAITAFSNVPLLTGGGVKFPATQVASADPNTLDDYEEGTWTPTIVGTTTAGTATYSYRVASYTKIGRVVTIACDVTYSAGTGTGNLTIAGLPFVSNASSTIAVGAPMLNNITTPALSQVTVYIASNESRITFLQFPLGGGTYGSIAYDAGGDINLTITYIV